MQGSGVSTNNKIFLAGLPWSVLVVATLWASDPAARSLAVVFAVVVLVLGWMVVTSLFCCSAASSPGQLANARHDREIIERSSEAMLRVSAEFSTQLGEIRSEVRRAQDIFSEAVGHLIGSFQDINMHVQRQRQLGMAAQDGMPVAIEDSEQAINKMAAQEMTFVLAAKSDIEQAKQRIEAVNGCAGDTVGELNLIAGQVEAAVNKAVLSLQFQDVVTQLLGHVGRRLDLLDEVASDEQRLAEVLLDSGHPEATLRALDALRDHVDQLAQKLVTLKKGVDNNPVSQTGHAGGDVELF
jgi:hypothetical protein